MEYQTDSDIKDLSYDNKSNTLRQTNIMPLSQIIVLWQLLANLSDSNIFWTRDIFSRYVVRVTEGES